MRGEEGLKKKRGERKNVGRDVGEKEGWRERWQSGRGPEGSESSAVSGRSRVGWQWARKRLACGCLVGWMDGGAMNGREGERKREGCSGGAAVTSEKHERAVPWRGHSRKRRWRETREL
jgi:hypothetical protein